MLEKINTDQALQWLIESGPDWATRLGVALAIFIIGRLLAKMAVALLRRVLKRGDVDPMLVGFLTSIAYMALLIAVIIGTLDALKFNTTSLIAIFGAAGLAIGLALQGSLSNFASGVMLVMFRPFSPGHFIEAAGVSGIVDTVRIFNTIIRTADNREVIVPNSQVLAGTITNYSVRGRRRIDMVIRIGYHDDIDTAKRLIRELLDAEERIHKEPVADIFVLELAEYSVELAVRAWVITADYWPVRGDIIQRIKQTFDANGITIPLPQREIRNITVESAA